jgi:hypothetical protein
LTQGKGELVAIDINTGNILWNKVFDSINVGSATVVNDVVFTATYDGMVYGFEAETGDQLFNFTAPAGINGWPAVAGDTIIWPAGVGINASLIAIRTSVSNISLFGSSLAGWGFTAGSMTNPGPAIIVNEGDLVNLTLTSVDGLQHIFFIDYNGDGNPSAGEPTSPAFQTTINFQFHATTSGQFSYYCQLHPTVMHGTFMVQGTELLAGDLNNDGVVDILDITLVAVAFDSELGDPNYNPIADLDGSGVIDIVDITMVAINFGNTVNP